MLNLVEQIKTYLTNQPTLNAVAVGGAYTTQIAYIWHLPTDLPSQTLVMGFEAEGATIMAPDTAETITMKLWYVASTLLEAMQFRDAIVTLLQHQEHRLTSSGSVLCDYIALEGKTVVGVPPDTGRPQFYAAFKIIA